MGDGGLNITVGGFHGGAAAESGAGEEVGADGEKRHSMIMYEMSAVLCGMRTECSGAFKRKIIVSGTRKPSMNTDFYGLTVFSLFFFKFL